MECRCNDHRPGNWHSRQGDCDCHKHSYPAYSFVVTKVMEQDPGTASVFISKDFMEKLQLEEGDPVEVVGADGVILQARSHPNPWVDRRMVSLDRQTMSHLECSLFSEVKLRKAECEECGTLTLEVPDGVSVTRLQLRQMVQGADGQIVSAREDISLRADDGYTVCFRIRDSEDRPAFRITGRTAVRLLDTDGNEYLAPQDTTFDDVGGLKEAVRRVREVVQLPLRHPEVFNKLGMEPPRGVLLYGPSGTGKTLIARAVAGETGCWFKAISGTEVMDKHYGESEARLRAAFEEAQKNAPAILFIDEIDALAPSRDTAEGDVERRITAQLLALMDGLVDRGNLMVLAATNMPNILDAALRRPGRFDREILIGVPDKHGRKEILEIHTRHMPINGVDLQGIADKTHGFVGADIRALCQEAGFRALKRILPGVEDTDETLTEDFLSAITVETEDFEAALENIQPSASRSFEVDLSAAGWDRIVGYDAQVEFMKEAILWPLKNLEYLTGLGVRHVSGLVLTGPSGTGKTLMARSLAKESGFNVIEIRGPELISKYMGESERNVREIFRQARQMAPTVVILDGLEAMTASSGGSDSRVINRVVNQLQMEMSAISSDKPILVVAVSRSAEDIPAALKATGRFSTELALNLPDRDERAELYRMYLNGPRVEFQGDFDKLAAESDGLAGGDVEEICRRTILHAARKAIDAGPEDNRPVCITEDEVLIMLDKWRITAPVHSL